MFMKKKMFEESLEGFSKIHGYNFRIRLAGACYSSIFVVLLISFLYDLIKNFSIATVNIYIWQLLFCFGISILIFFERRFGIYFGFFYSFYLLWDIINEALHITKIKLPQIFICIFLILACSLLIPVVIRDTKYIPPKEISDDPQTVLLEFFFFFMILGVIGFCLILLQK